MRTLASSLIAAVVVLALPTSSFAQDDTDDDMSNGDVEPPSGHFRVDIDKLGLQAWALGQFPINDKVAFAGNIYAIENGSSASTTPAGMQTSWRPYSRVDAGVIFRLGVFELFPKLGFAFDYGNGEAATLVPQLFAIVRGGPLHIETWNQVFWSSLFDDDNVDVFYTRNQLLLSPWNVIGFGFQIEATIGIHNRLGDALMSLPVGGTIQLKPSPTDVIQAFVAGETDDGAASGGALTGRLTYLHTF